MENHKEYYIDLITRHLAGELSPDEVQELADWVSLYPENFRTYEIFSKTWDAIEKDTIEKNVDIDEEWEKINLRLKHSESLGDNNVKIFRSSNGINSVKKIFFPFLKIAAIFLFVSIASFAIYFFTGAGREKTLIATGDYLEKNLPDGTNITMSSGSKLIYPEKFGRHERKVKLSGEAYFNVQHDSKKPFIIATDGVRIKVLGTSFYVNTKATKGNIEVVLTTGKLAIFYKNKSNEMVVLSPGEKATVNKNTGIIKKNQNDDLNYMAWKNKKIVFFNNTLSDIIITLNRVYHTNIIIKDDRIANFRLTVSFDNQTLESVLNVIKKTLDINVKPSETNIELSGNGCR